MAVDLNGTRRDGDLDDAGLDAFFSAGRGPDNRPEALPAPLIRRILADAEVVATGGPAEVLAVRRSFWSGVLAAIGGWPAMAGMATATVAGVWLGFARPSALDGVLSFGADYSLSDFMASVDLADGG
jgi:hypothetical protein